MDHLKAILTGFIWLGIPILTLYFIYRFIGPDFLLGTAFGIMLLILCWAVGITVQIVKEVNKLEKHFEKLKKDR